MSDAATLRAEVPAVEAYLALRCAAGLSAMSARGAELGLPHSWHAVCVREGDELIGMGRVIGDGGLFFQLVDIAVRPDRQGRGWGKRIVAALIDELQSRAPAGALVSLLADGEAARLYSQFGFVPAAPASQGMLRRLSPTL